MKILLINHFPLEGSGSGVYVGNIAKSLQKKGNQVCIIMPENTIHICDMGNVKVHPVFFKKEEIIQGQLDFNFPCMDPHPRSNFLFHNMTELQIQQYENAFRKAIEEEIEEFQPDIIHSQHIWIISGLLENYKIPYIITSHGAEFITYKKTNVFDRYGFSATRSCEKLIYISDENKNEIINKFPDAKEKLVYLKNGYNSNDFFVEELNKTEILKKFSINKTFKKIVLFVGRISKMKGVDVLLKSAKLYENEDVLTLIVGDGEFRQDLNILAEELALQNVVFLGNKSQNDLRLLYNICDVLVLPSKKEAMPLVAIEAWACGKPAIVTEQFGINFVNEEVGFTFEMDNEKDLAEKINKILNEEVIFDKNKIAEYAKANYSQEGFMDKLLRIYEEIL